MPCHLLEPKLSLRETVNPPSVCLLRLLRRRGTGIILDTNVVVGQLLSVLRFWNVPISSAGHLLQGLSWLNCCARQL